MLEERLGPLPPNFTPNFYSLTAVVFRVVAFGSAGELSLIPGSRRKGRHDIVRLAWIRTVTIFLFLVSFSYPNKRYSQRSTFISAL